MKIACLAAMVLLGASAMGCSPSSEDESKSDDEQAGAATPAEETPASPAPATPDAPAADPAPAAPAAIAPAKIHAAPVWSYAVTADAVWVATGTTVNKAALDGSGPAPVPALERAYSLGEGGARVYAFVDKGTGGELHSIKPDGAEATRHSTFRFGDGVPVSPVVHDGRVYFDVVRSDRPAQSTIASIPAAPPVGSGTVSFRHEAYVDAQTIPPAFATGRLFAVDYHRQTTVRVSLVDASPNVDIIRAAQPRHAGGIATDGKDVYTRTAQGIVKVAAAVAAVTEPTVVIPAATCSIFDPGSGAQSVFEDALVLDGGTLYVACRVGDGVEIRAYGVDGKLVKVVAPVPYTGGITHLRVAGDAVYWQSRVSPTSADDELWRAGK